MCYIWPPLLPTSLRRLVQVNFLFRFRVLFSYLILATCVNRLLTLFITIKRTQCVFNIKAAEDMRAKSTKTNLALVAKCAVLPGFSLFLIIKLLPDLFAASGVIERQSADDFFWSSFVIFFGLIALVMAVLGTLIVTKIKANRQFLDERSTELVVNGGRGQGVEQGALMISASRQRRRCHEEEWRRCNQHRNNHHFRNIPCHHLDQRENDDSDRNNHHFRNIPCHHLDHRQDDNSRHYHHYRNIPCHHKGGEDGDIGHNHHFCNIPSHHDYREESDISHGMEVVRFTGGNTVTFGYEHGRRHGSRSDDTHGYTSTRLQRMREEQRYNHRRDHNYIFNNNNNNHIQRNYGLCCGGSHACGDCGSGGVHGCVGGCGIDGGGGGGIGSGRGNRRQCFYCNISTQTSPGNVGASEHGPPNTPVAHRGENGDSGCASITPPPIGVSVHSLFVLFFKCKTVLKAFLFLGIGAVIKQDDPEVAVMKQLSLYAKKAKCY